MLKKHSRVRFFLIDEHTLVREAMRDLLSSQEDLEVVGESDGSPGTLDNIRSLSPDLVILDVDDARNIILATQQIVAGTPSIAVVVVSPRTEPDEIRALCEAGVSGYVSKNSSAKELVRVLRAAVQGTFSMCPITTSALVRAMRTGGEASKVLNGRQQEVLARLAQGMTTREVAEDLKLSPKTVEKRRAEILKLLEAKNLVVAIDKARKMNLLEAPM